MSLALHLNLGTRGLSPLTLLAFLQQTILELFPECRGSERTCALPRSPGEGTASAIWGPAYEVPINNSPLDVRNRYKSENQTKLAGVQRGSMQEDYVRSEGAEEAPGDMPMFSSP